LNLLSAHLSPLLCLWVGLLLLLLAEWRSLTFLKWLGKSAASAAFVWLALDAGATQSLYGQGILVGLGLSMLGDLLLIPKAKMSFLLGLGAFLLGHVAYAISFAFTGANSGVALLCLLGLLPVRLMVLAWLMPKVESSMQLPVQAYAAVITLMLGFALASVSSHGFLAAAGAAFFYISDLAVARDRFVAPGLINRLFGLPAYYLGQALLALSVTQA